MRNNWFFLAAALSTAAFSQGLAQQMQTGLASYYSDGLNGQVTAYGENYDRNALTCAHQWHPKGTLLRVTNQSNNQSVVVRVNDKGPFQEGYIVALSYAAANQIGLTLSGKALVGVEPVGYADRNAYAPNYVSQDSRPDFQNQQLVNDGFEVNTVRSMLPGQQGYTVQVAAFNDYSHASNQIILLQKQGIRDAYLLERTNESGSVYRIVLGVFPEKSMAEEYLQRLRTAYQLNGLVIMLR